jgi:hypothetical protein
MINSDPARISRKVLLMLETMLRRTNVPIDTAMNKNSITPTCSNIKKEKVLILLTSYRLFLWTLFKGFLSHRHFLSLSAPLTIYTLLLSFKHIYKYKADQPPQ